MKNDGEYRGLDPVGEELFVAKKTMGKSNEKTVTKAKGYKKKGGFKKPSNLIKKD